MLKKIPRFKPSIQWDTLCAITRWACISRSNTFLQTSDSFDKFFSEYLDVGYVIPVSSGRTGLYLILKNSGFNINDEVIFPAFTYWAVPAVVRELQLRPVFVDIDPATCNLDARLIEKKITKRTKAIVPTHLYGLPCDMDEILRISQKHGLVVIEDCVQSLGASCGERMTGSMGNASYFSFGLTKSMPLLAGGMVATNNLELACRIKKDVESFPVLGDLGIMRKVIVAAAMKMATSIPIFDLLLFPLIYGCDLLGKNVIDYIFEEKANSTGTMNITGLKSPPATLTGLLGPIVFSKIAGLIKRRTHNGNYLQNHIHSNPSLTLPPSCAGNVFTSFPVRANLRDKIRSRLLYKGIDTSSGFMKAFADDCPNAATMEKQILHLPVYPFLTEPELTYISKSFNAVIHEG